MAEIRLEGVTKRYGDLVALDKIDLTIESASFTSVFGPPGSGKSVLLRVLLGLEPVDEGRILIDGLDMTGSAPNARNLGMVFQNLALFPHLTSRDNIAFPMRRKKMAEREIDRRIDDLAGVLSIGHILHKKPGALSGGERQRVAISRALIRDAAAYLMDEPIAALDARLRDDMRVELKRLQSELGKTFIYVTHDCDEAMSVADTMVILEKGRIAQIGRPDTIYADPRSIHVAEAVGSPRINVLQGQRRKEGLECSFGTLPFLATLESKTTIEAETCTIALRPESVRLHDPDAEPKCRGRIVDVERLGAFAIVTVREGADEIRAVTPGDTAVAVGEIVGLTVDLEGILLFDPRVGDRIN